MKKLPTILFAIMLMPLMALADTWKDPNTGITWTYGTWTYESSYGMAMVGQDDWLAIPDTTTGAITIPSTLGGYPVWCIGSYAFYGCRGLTSVRIPKGVTDIYQRAFSGCSGLTSVTIPESVTGIGSYAFYGCSGLTSITIPKSVRYMDRAIFAECRGLTSVTFSEGVTSIGYSAFWNCTSLTSVTIPKSMQDIGQWAFYGCESLTSMTIPKNVRSIGSFAFDNCFALKTVYAAKGDTGRIKALLRDAGCNPDWLEFVEVEGLESEPESEPQSGFESDPRSDETVVPDPGSESDPAVEPGYNPGDWTVKHTFNGLVTDLTGTMLGLAQVVTARITKKGEVSVTGFVMLQDGKKTNLKGKGKVEDGVLKVSSEIKKQGTLNLTVGGDGFSGALGSMKLLSASIGENTGILKATVKLSYFDAKTGKLKTKSLNLGGVSDGGEAVGTVTDKKAKTEKAFEAVVE